MKKIYSLFLVCTAVFTAYAQAPTNDECDNAISLTLDALTAGTTINATASSQATNGLEGNPNDDVWFSFVATETFHSIEALNASNPTLQLTLAAYDGSNGCAALTFVEKSISIYPSTVLQLKGLTVGNTYYVRAYGFSDNLSGQNFDMYLRTKSPIVLTEISYNPAESGTDLTEYIELYNRGNTAVNLDGYQFSSGVVYSFPSGIILDPGAFFVVASNATEVMSRYGVTGVYQFDSGGLSNGGEPIGLKNTLGALVLYARYDDNQPWPDGSNGAADPDGGGSSIEYCDITEENTIFTSTDAAYGQNWTESTTSTGVTVNGSLVYGSPGTMGTACANLDVDTVGNIVKKVSVFPNPSSEFVQVTFPEIKNNVELILSNIQGSIIFKQTYSAIKNTNIKLKGATGIYFLTIKTQEGKETIKLIKK